MPKSDKGRRDLPLATDLARRLWRLQRGPEQLLFTAPQGGRLEYGNTYRRVLTPTLERASTALRMTQSHEPDVTWAAWHTFRHTVASRLFAQGRNVKQVQEWLGHHKASFTLDTYVHLMGGGIGGPLTLPAMETPLPQRRRQKNRHGGQQGANRRPKRAGNGEATANAKTTDLQA